MRRPRKPSPISMKSKENLSNLYRTRRTCQNHSTSSSSVTTASKRPEKTRIGSAKSRLPSSRPRKLVQFFARTIRCKSCSKLNSEIINSERKDQKFVERLLS